jgi:CdvA-like coiled-coil domain
LYGRILGRVIGIDRNPYGELEGVQIEAVAGNILVAKTRQLALTPKAVTLTPEWKLDVDDIISELTLLRKRVTALESLKDTREIDGEIYAELLDAQRSGYLDKVKAAEALARSMKMHLGDISGQLSSLTRFLVQAKLGHKSGEVDDASLKLAQESIEPSLRPLIAEKNDLTSELKGLERILPARVEVT